MVVLRNYYSCSTTTSIMDLHVLSIVEIVSYLGYSVEALGPCLAEPASLPTKRVLRSQVPKELQDRCETGTAGPTVSHGL